jgi:Lrp/AsnC family transcriptional regulator
MGGFRADGLDFRILELLVKDARTQNRELASKLGVDKRTIAKRLERMRREGVLKHAIDIDWSMLGVGVSAYVGSTTALGEEDVAKLYEFIRTEPRVVEAYSTVGSNEYFLRVLDVDLQTLREEVLRKLEPLTADLATSIVSSQIKPKNLSAFLAFLQGCRKTQRENIPEMS